MPDADAASTDRRAEEDVARAGPAGVAAARAPCATPLKAARARLSRIPGKPALLGTIVRVLPPARVDACAADVAGAVLSAGAPRGRQVRYSIQYHTRSPSVTPGLFFDLSLLAWCRSLPPHSGRWRC
jgi:hypothetical protein